MLQLLQTAARRSLRTVERSKAADVLLFYIAILAKLLLFNAMINVHDMQTMPDDILVDLGTLAIAAFWTFWLPPRGRIVALALLNLLLTSILYADLIYYRYFQDLISIPVLMQAGQVDSLGASILTLVHFKDLIYFADWLIVIPAACRALYNRRRSAERLSSGHTWRIIKLRFAAGLLMFAAGMTLVFVPVGIAKNTWASGLFPKPWWNVSLYNVTGLYGYHGYDTFRYLEDNVWSSTQSLPGDQQAEAKRWFREHGLLRHSLESDPLFGAYKNKNVILVQAEAFQSFLIGRSIGGVPITPNLNKLLESSLYFDRFYHQASSGRTADADFGAQCSLQPAQSGAVFIRFASHTFDCTPSVLKAHGYSTSVYHAYDGGFWNRNAMYKSMQYDTFYSKRAFAIDEPLGWSLGDKSFFRQSTRFISEQKQPFYSFLITLSSHHPFKIPAGLQTLNVGPYKGTMFGDYLQAAHYVDAAMGEFVSGLKREGLWRNSIFLFYGDHDNSIHDWPRYESFLGRKLPEMERQLMLRQVPFIVHLPDERLKGTRSEPGGQLDISPTILHLLGIPTADEYMIGMPLVLGRPLSGRTVVFRSGAYTDGSLFYMPGSGNTGANPVCYGLAGGKQLRQQACAAGADKARRQLAMSDRVVEYDLIRSFRSPNTAKPPERPE